MKALLPGIAPKNFKRVETDAARRPRPGRGPGAGPSHRDLRDRHQRLPRQDAVLQLSPHPRPRAGGRGGRGRRGRDERQGRRPLLGRALHQRPEQLRQPARASRTAARSWKSSASTATAGCGRGSSCPRGSSTRRRRWRSTSSPWSRPWPSAATRSTARRSQPDESCLVIGAGPIGLATLEFVKLTGAKTIVLDMNEQRLDFCKTVMGVEHTVKLSENVEKDLRDLTDGHLPDVVIDATGLERLDVGRLRLRRAGRAGWSTSGSRPTRSGSGTRSSTSPRGRSSARGTPCPRDFTRIIGLIEDGRIDTKPWITHRAGVRRPARPLPVVHQARDGRHQGHRRGRLTDDRESDDDAENRRRTVRATLGLSPSFGFGDRIGLATPGHVEAMATCRVGDRADLPAAVDPRDGPDRPDPAAGDGRRPRRDARRRLGRPHRRRRRPPEDHRRTSTPRPPSASPSSRSTRPTTSTPTPTTTTSRPSASRFAAVAGEVGWLDALPGQVGQARRPGRRSTSTSRPASAPRSSTAGP